MLLLLQSYVTFQQFPTQGQVIQDTIKPEYVDNGDDELLAAWFMFMRQPYETRNNKDSA